RHAAAQKGPDPLLVPRARLAVYRVGIDAVAEVQTRQLETARRVVRESVVEAVGVLDDVDRQLREGAEIAQRLEPEEHAALDPEMRRELPQQTRQPGTRRDHQTPRAVAALGRGHANAVAVALPAVDRLGGAQPRALPPV